MASHRLSNAGLSLPELLVVIGVVGVFAAIAIPNYMSVIPVSQQVGMRDGATKLNRAVLHYKQVVGRIQIPADDGGLEDEFEVLDLLQYRDPVNPIPGTPLLPAYIQAEPVDAENEYRIIWNGRVFVVVGPETSGPGIRLFSAGP